VINYLKEMLNDPKQRAIFWKHHRHDHFVIFGINIYQMIGIGVKQLYQQICINCSTLVIEASASFTPNYLLAKTIPSLRQKNSRQVGWLEKSYWYSVPYPSSFHWHEGIGDKLSSVNKHGILSSSVGSNVPTISSVTNFNLNLHIQPPRPILSLFIGSVRTSNMASNALRRELQRQCLHYSNLTISSSTSSSTTIQPSCHWYSIAHACTGVLNASSEMQLFLQATFCPAPPGDSLTRKSICDALLTSCIPAIFDAMSLGLYFWHFTAK
jgi:hypothetical protein